MFEKVVWGIVQYYAYKYAKGIKPEELKISLWQGHAAMNNIELNTDELESLNLPLHVKRGFIRELCVRIPWTAILSDSVQVDVKGLVLEMIPNHQYQPSAKEPKENSANAEAKGMKPPQASPYTSQLAQSILDNIKVNVEDIRMSFSDTQGSFPSIVHVSIDRVRILPSSAPLLIADGAEHASSCVGCAAVEVDSVWSSGPKPPKEGKAAALDKRRDIIVDNLSVRVEEVEGRTARGGDAGTASGTSDDPPKGPVEPDLERMQHVMQNVSVTTVLVVRSVPFTHLHFCHVSSSDPVHLDLRDIDLQAFCLMLNELKAIFSKEGLRKGVDVPANAPEAANGEDAGVYSWMSSAMDKYSSWLRGPAAPQPVPAHLLSPRSAKSAEKASETVAAQFEPNELKLLLEKEKSTKKPVDPNALATTHLSFSFPSFSCTLTQHVEFPLVTQGIFCVAPREVIKVRVDGIRVQREERGKHARMHISIDSVSVDDLWTEGTLFPEIVGPRDSFWNQSSLDVSTGSMSDPLPLIHISYQHDLDNGVLPDMVVNVEPLQVACPPLLAKRIAIFFDTALPKQHALFKRHPHLKKIHEEQADITAARTAARSGGTKKRKPKLEMGVRLSIAALRLLVCRQNALPQSECLVVDTTQLLLVKVPQGRQEGSTADLFKSPPRHYRMILQDLQVSTGTVESMLGNETFVLVQPLTLEFHVRISDTPDALCNAPLQTREANLAPDEEPANEHAQYVSIDCTINRLNGSVAKEQISNVAAVIGHLAEALSSSGGSILTAPHSSPPPDDWAPPSECTWRPLYGSHSLEPAEDSGKSKVEAKTFVYLHSHCEEVSVLFVRTDEDIEGLGCTYTPLIELQVQHLDAELSVYANQGTDKQIVRAGGAVASLLVLDRMSPGTKPAVIFSAMPDQSANTFFGPTTDSPFTPLFHTQPSTSQVEAVATPMQGRPNPATATTVPPGTPLHAKPASAFPADYNFVTSTPSVVQLQTRAVARPELLASRIFPSAMLGSTEGIGNLRSRLPAAKDSAMRMTLMRLVAPGAGTVPEVRARIQVSQVQVTFHTTLLVVVKEFAVSSSDVSASSAAGKKRSAKAKLRDLTEAQLHWQFAFLKMRAVLQQQMRQKAVDDGVMCLRFARWQDWEAFSRLNPTPEHWLSFSMLSSYFQSVLSQLNVTISQVTISVPGVSTVVSSTQLDVVIPNVIIHTAQQSGFSYGTHVLEASVKQVHGYLSRFNNVQNSASLYDSVDGASADDLSRCSSQLFNYNDVDEGDSVSDASFLGSIREGSSLFGPPTPGSGIAEALYGSSVPSGAGDDRMALSKTKFFSVDQAAAKIVSRLNRQGQSSVLFAVDGFVENVHSTVSPELARDILDVAYFTRESVLDLDYAARPPTPQPKLAQPHADAPDGGAITCFNCMVKRVGLVCVSDESDQELARLHMADIELIHSTHRESDLNLRVSLGSVRITDDSLMVDGADILAPTVEHPLMALFVSKTRQGDLSDSPSLWSVEVQFTGYLLRYRPSFLKFLRGIGTDAVREPPVPLLQAAAHSSPSAPDGLASPDFRASESVRPKRKQIVNVVANVTNVRVIVAGPSQEDVTREHAGHFLFQKLATTFVHDEVAGKTSLALGVTDGRFAAGSQARVDLFDDAASITLAKGSLEASKHHQGVGEAVLHVLPDCWYLDVKLAQPRGILSESHISDLGHWLGSFGERREQTQPKAAGTEKATQERKAMRFTLTEPKVVLLGSDGTTVVQVGLDRLDITDSRRLPSRPDGAVFTLYDLHGSVLLGETMVTFLSCEGDDQQEPWAMEFKLLKAKCSPDAADSSPTQQILVNVGNLELSIAPLKQAMDLLSTALPAAPAKPSDVPAGPTEQRRRVIKEVSLSAVSVCANFTSVASGKTMAFGLVNGSGRAVLQGMALSRLLDLDCHCAKAFIEYCDPQAVIPAPMMLAEIFGSCCKLQKATTESPPVIFSDVDVVKADVPIVEIVGINALCREIADCFSDGLTPSSVPDAPSFLQLPATLGVLSGPAEVGRIVFSPSSSAALLDGGYSWQGQGSRPSDVTEVGWTFLEPRVVLGISWTASSSDALSRPLSASLYRFSDETDAFELACSPLPANTLAENVKAYLPTMAPSHAWKLVLHPRDGGTALHFPDLHDLQITSASVAPQGAASSPSSAFELQFRTTVSYVELAASTVHTSDSPLFVLKNDTLRLELDVRRTARLLDLMGSAKGNSSLIYQNFATLSLERVLVAHPELALSFSRQYTSASSYLDKLVMSVSQKPDAPTLSVRVTRPLIQLLRNATSFLQLHGTGGPRPGDVASREDLEEDMGMFYHYRIRNCTDAPIRIRDTACEGAAPFRVEGQGMVRHFKWNLSDVSAADRRIQVVWDGVWVSDELDIRSNVTSSWLLLRNGSKVHRMALVVSSPQSDDAPPGADRSTISRVYELCFCLSHKLVNTTDVPIFLRFSVGDKDTDVQLSPCVSSSTGQAHYMSIAGEGATRMRLGCAASHAWSSAMVVRDSQCASLVRCYDLKAKKERYFWLTVRKESMTASHQDTAAEEMNFVVLSVAPVYDLRNESLLPLCWRLEQRGSYVYGQVAPLARACLYANPRTKTLLALAAAGGSREDDRAWSTPMDLTAGLSSKTLYMNSELGRVQGAGFAETISVYLELQASVTPLSSRLLVVSPSCSIENKTNETIWVGQVSGKEKTSMLDGLCLESGASVPYAFSFPNEKPLSFAIFKSSQSSSAKAVPSLSVDHVDTLFGMSLSGESGTYLAGYSSREDGCVLNHQFAVSIEGTEARTSLTVRPSVVVVNHTESPMEASAGSDEKNCSLHAITLPEGGSGHIHHWLSSEPEVLSRIFSLQLRFAGHGWAWRPVDLYGKTDAAGDTRVRELTCMWTNSICQEVLGCTVRVCSMDVGTVRVDVFPCPPPAFLFRSHLPFVLHCQVLDVPKGEEEEDGDERRDRITLHPGGTFPLRWKEASLRLCLRLNDRQPWSSSVPVSRPRSTVLRLFGKEGSVAVLIRVEYEGDRAFVTFEAVIQHGVPPPSRHPYHGRGSRHLTGREAKSRSGELAVTREAGASEPASLQSRLQMELPAVAISLVTEDGANLRELVEVVATGLRLEVQPRGAAQTVDIKASGDYFAVLNGSNKEHVVLEWAGLQHEALRVDVSVPVPSRHLLSRLSVRMAPLVINLDDSFVRVILEAAPRWIGAITYSTQVHQRRKARTAAASHAPPPSYAPKMCVCQFELSSWRLTVSWRNVKRVLPFYVPDNLLSIRQLCLTFSGIQLDDVPTTVDSVALRIAAKYKQDVLWQVLGVVGAVELLGNPAQLVRDVTYVVGRFVDTLPWLGRHQPTGGALVKISSLRQSTGSLLFGFSGSLVTAAVTLSFSLAEIFNGLERSLSVEYSGDVQEHAVASRRRSSGVRNSLHEARIALERAVRQSVTGVLSLRTAAGWISSLRAGLDVNAQLLLVARNWLLAANTLLPPPAPRVRSDKHPLRQHMLRRDASALKWQLQQELPADVAELVPKGHSHLLHLPVTLLTQQFGTPIRHERMLLLTDRAVIVTSGRITTLAAALEDLQEIRSLLDAPILVVKASQPHTQSSASTEVVEMEFRDAESRAAFVAALTQRYLALTGNLLPHLKLLPVQARLLVEAEP